MKPASGKSAEFEVWIINGVEVCFQCVVAQFSPSLARLTTDQLFIHLINQT